MESVSTKRSAAAWLPRWILFLCVVQPVLNVISYWVNSLHAGNTATLLARMVLLLAAVITAFVLSGKKRAYALLLAVLAALAAGHVWACVRAGGRYGPAAALIDLTNYVRVIQMPLLTFCFITYLRISRERGYAAVERGLEVTLLLIAAVELLSAVTGTNPYTYPNKSIGLVGWFYFANAQSAVLSMLAPLVLCIVMRRGRAWQTAAISVLSFGMLYLFATRLTYLAIFITAIGTLFVWAVNRRLDRRAAAILLVCMILCAAGYAVSPMHQNRVLLGASEQKKQEEIDRLVDKGRAEYGDDGIEYLTYAYDAYQRPLVERFGLARTVEIYNGSTKMEQIANVRVTRLNYCRLLLDELPASSRWFGLNFNDMTYQDQIFDVENDFHGILYLYGYAGFGCLVLFLLYFFYLIAAALVRNAKRYFTVEAGACGIALCSALIHAYATAGVLRRPNASFYLSLVLAMIWYLVRERSYPEPKEG